MVRKGFLYGKETPSSNLISRHEQTNPIFSENEKRLAKTFVCLCFLCQKPPIFLILTIYLTITLCVAKQMLSG